MADWPSGKSAGLEITHANKHENQQVLKSILHIYLVKDSWEFPLPSFICCLGRRCVNQSSAVD